LACVGLTVPLNATSTFLPESSEAIEFPVVKIFNKAKLSSIKIRKDLLECVKEMNEGEWL